jgi:REP element-mobilizing transposase RayT
MSGDRYKIQDQQGYYFVTFTVVGWLDVFVRREYKDIIVNSLNYCIKEKGLLVHAWCLMTSHIHLVLSCQEGYNLSAIIRDFKKHTAKQIVAAIKEIPESRRNFLLWYFEREGKKDARISQYKFWKADNHAIQLYAYETQIAQQKLDYIHNNPVKEGIVANSYEYVYSSAVDYAGGKGLVAVELMV